MRAQRNLYGVQQKQWREWSEPARCAFNRSYRFIKNNQHLMIHPKAATATRTQWSTVAWNAAWVAADATDDTIVTEMVGVPSGRKLKVV